MVASRLAAVVLAGTVVAAAEAPTRVPVFVRGAEVGGFSRIRARTARTSVKDLKKKLKESELVQLVESEAEARAVLEVLDRETKRETNGWTAVGGWRQNKSYLTVRLIVGEHAIEFTGEQMKGMLKGYGAAAGQVAKQLEAWIQANHERLTAAMK